MDKYYGSANNLNSTALTQVDVSSTNQLRKSNSLSNISQMFPTEPNSAMLNKMLSVNEINKAQESRFNLMDKKKQKWENDLSKLVLIVLLSKKKVL